MFFRRRTPYLTAPVPSTEMPRGIPYIVANEAAERFSYYGMMTILVVFMTKNLLDRQGQKAVMEKDEAMYWFHSFVAAVYFLPLLGAIVSDVFLGKYRTIVILSIVYCLGHLALAIDDTRRGLVIGLGLIAFGSGGIKPCVSAHVGDQFGHCNRHLLEKVFYWFYFAINFGSAISTALTPWLLETFGAHVAFGVPGALMLLATWVFWLGRRKFVHVPAGGWNFLREISSKEGWMALARLSAIFAFVAVFWSLYSQTGSAWVLQAERMDCRIWRGFTVLPAQVQTINPVLVMIFIPLFAYGVFPAIEWVFPLTALRKISLGFFVTSLAFVVSAWVQGRIDMGETPSILWQFLAYAILTAAEVMVSVTCLEFTYSQAPKSMKSAVMALSLLSVSLGNAFTALVSYGMENWGLAETLKGPRYYWFFCTIMIVAATAFVLVARMYPLRTYLQDEAAPDAA